MEFMLLFTQRKGTECGPGGMAEMQEFAAELASQGKLRRGAPLAPEATGARVRVRAGQAFVSDGPFAESKEVVGGFFLVEAASREEAIEIARRAPHARWGNVEVSLAPGRLAVADSGRGAPFLLAYHVEPGLTDPDGSKMREMIAYGEALEREGKFLESAPLAREPRPARLEPRDGKVLVTDGPFAETREMVGGYGIVRAGSRAEAIEIAKHCPHARWGPIEVREILYFDPV